MRVEVEKRVTVAVVCAPVERERYVAVDTDSAYDVLVPAVFVLEDRAVLVCVPAKLVERDVPEACTVPVWVLVPVVCVAAAGAWCVVASLSPFKLPRSDAVVQGTGRWPCTHVCTARVVCLCVCAMRPLASSANSGSSCSGAGVETGDATHSTRMLARASRENKMRVAYISGAGGLCLWQSGSGRGRDCRRRTSDTVRTPPTQLLIYGTSVG